MKREEKKTVGGGGASQRRSGVIRTIRKEKGEKKEEVSNKNRLRCSRWPLWL